MRASLPSSILLGLFLLACGDNGGGMGADERDGGNDNGTDGAPAADAAPSAGCAAPDMLILLDRTMSMHRRPTGEQPANDPAGHASSKWALAVTSLEAVTASLDAHLRFGLALFPRDPADGSCVTLEERIDGVIASNDRCEPGELVVEPAIGAAPAIAAAIDVEATRLCRSTPIGAGLATARDALAARADGEREQFVVLVTDGQDTCDEDLVLATAHALRGDGVRLYAIGFDGSGGSGVDAALLSDLACAGGTAPGFPAGCVDQGGGAYVAEDPDGPPLFQLAEDAAELEAALEAFASDVCCGCVD